MSSTLKALVTAATKVATKTALDKGLNVGNTIKDMISSTGAIVAGESSEKLAQKVGLLRENRFGELVLKVPFFKTVEEKIEAAFAEHPQRKKMCFGFKESLRSGVKFYDENANVVFEIPENKKNLRQIEIYKGDRFVGRIEKKVTINLNPLADIQKYTTWVHASNGIVTVKGFDSSIDTASWKLKHQRAGNYIVEDKDGIEIGKVFSFGYGHFALDYEASVDPVELLLTFMAIKIRAEELKDNHNYGHGGQSGIEGFVADLKDIF